LYLSSDNLGVLKVKSDICYLAKLLKEHSIDYTIS